MEGELRGHEFPSELGLIALKRTRGSKRSN